mmetsp:Transcript_5442/g.11462  ORF Transcript_5442/g.11462 Transcript_5442/m.11462 type:complete len:538 (-) Transcript_5442:909-2522(-)
MFFDFPPPHPIGKQTRRRSCPRLYSFRHSFRSSFVAFVVVAVVVFLCFVEHRGPLRGDPHRPGEQRLPAFFLLRGALARGQVPREFLDRRSRRRQQQRARRITTDATASVVVHTHPFRQSRRPEEVGPLVDRGSILKDGKVGAVQFIGFVQGCLVVILVPRFWSFPLVDVGHPRNGLPDGLRRRLLPCRTNRRGRSGTIVATSALFVVVRAVVVVVGDDPRPRAFVPGAHQIPEFLELDDALDQLVSLEMGVFELGQRVAVRLPFFYDARFAVVSEGLVPRIHKGGEGFSRPQSVVHVEADHPAVGIPNHRHGNGGFQFLRRDVTVGQHLVGRQVEEVAVDVRPRDPFPAVHGSKEDVMHRDQEQPSHQQESPDARSHKHEAEEERRQQKETRVEARGCLAEPEDRCGESLVVVVVVVVFRKGNKPPQTQVPRYHHSADGVVSRPDRKVCPFPRPVGVKEERHSPFVLPRRTLHRPRGNPVCLRERGSTGSRNVNEQQVFGFGTKETLPGGIFGALRIGILPRVVVVVVLFPEPRHF